MELTRRRLVGTGSLVTVAALAGCLDDGGSPASGNGNGDDGDGNESGNGNGDDGNGNESGNGNGDDAEDGGDGNETDDGEGSDDGGNQSEDDVDGSGDADDGSGEDEGGETDTTSGDGYDSLAFSTSSVPETDADPLYTEDEARSTLALEDWQEGTRERVDSFLADTDFDSSVIVALRTRAPNQCYEFVLTDAEIGDDGVSVRAAAVDDDAQGACTQVENGLWLLVRLSADGDVPNEGTVTIVDADGNEHGFGYARESASAGDGSSSSGNSTDGSDQSRLGFLRSR